MSKMTRANYDAIRDHLFDRINKNGQQLKNDFPNTLRIAIKTEAWKQYADPTNLKPFENLVDWLQSTFPHGASMGQDRHAISYEDALKLCEGAPDVYRVLAENAPSPIVGRPGCKGSSAIPFQRGKTRSNTAAVLSVRLAQEKPKYYEAYMRGEYASVTAAAVAAGLRKDDANGRRARSGFRKMTPAEQQEHILWMHENYPKNFERAIRHLLRNGWTLPT